jgi:hypothetical protein
MSSGLVVSFKGTYSSLAAIRTYSLVDLIDADALSRPETGKYGRNEAYLNCGSGIFEDWQTVYNASGCQLYDGK